MHLSHRRPCLPALCALLGLLCVSLASAPAPAAAAGGPATFDEPSQLPWIGPVYFSWFDVTKAGRPRGQYYSPWLPKEGRLKWNGSVRFHKRHIKHITKAGFNMIFAVDTHFYRDEQESLFRAIRQRLDRGQRAPSVAPYFAAGSLACRECRRDFSTAKARHELYQVIKTWFERYFEVLGRRQLVTLDGKVVIGMWWIPGAETAPAGMFDAFGARLEEDFGFPVFWSTNFTWEPAGPDEFNWTFASLDPFMINDRGNMDLLPGFWPPENHDPADFLARDRGATFEEAWDRVINRTEPIACSEDGRPPERITITSYNELTEGSGIYPARCVGHRRGDAHFSGKPNERRCLNKPCHPHPKEDAWADCSQKRAPFLYLDISKRKIAELRNKLLRSDCD